LWDIIFVSQKNKVVKKNMKKEGIKINKQLIIAGISVGVLVVILIAVFATKQSGKKPGIISERETAAGFVQTDTRKTVPEGMVIPEVGENVSDKELAVPTVVTSAAPGVEAKLRAFAVKADKGRFDPSKIIVNKGDTVNIVIDAVDKAYDFTIPDFGVRQTLTKGERKVVEFQAASEGQFVYYCDSCGGINSSAKGTITIVP